jgi:hypothetical protein
MDGTGNGQPLTKAEFLEAIGRIQEAMSRLQTDTGQLRADMGQPRADMDERFQSLDELFHTFRQHFDERWHCAETRLLRCFAEAASRIASL